MPTRELHLWLGPHLHPEPRPLGPYLLLQVLVLSAWETLLQMFKVGGVWCMSPQSMGYLDRCGFPQTGLTLGTKQAHTCSPSLLIYREGRRDPLLQGIANQIAFYLLRNSNPFIFLKKICGDDL